MSEQEFCVKCGKPMSAEAKFCAACGHPRGAPVIKAAKRSGSIVLKVLVAFMAIGFVLVVVTALTDHGTRKEPAKPSPQAATIDCQQYARQLQTSLYNQGLELTVLPSTEGPGAFEIWGSVVDLMFVQEMLQPEALAAMRRAQCHQIEFVNTDEGRAFVQAYEIGSTEVPLVARLRHNAKTKKWELPEE
jgi:hypothetical protein